MTTIESDWENTRLKEQISRLEIELAATQADKLILIRKMRSALSQEFHEDSDNILHLALSTPPDDMMALRAIIAQVIEDNSGKFTPIEAIKLRSGEWTPEALK